MSFFILLIPYSLPFELVKAVPSQQRVLHRLVYRCFPALDQHKRDSLATHFIRLEVPLVDLKQAQFPVGASGGSVLANTLSWSGSSTNLDILMPDRYGSRLSSFSRLHLMVVCQPDGPSLYYLGYEPPYFRSVTWRNTQLPERP